MTAHRLRTDSSIVRMLAALSVLACLAASLPVWGADIYWTGLGDGTAWGDTNNWDLLRVPAAGDTVRLGYAKDGLDNDVNDTAQNIVLGEATQVTSLYLEPTGDRAVTLSGANLTYSGSVLMTSNATAQATVALTTEGDGAYRTLRNDSTNALLTVGAHTGTRSHYGAGTIRITGTQSGVGRFYGEEGGTFIGDVAGAYVINQAVGFFDTPTLLFAQSCGFSRVWSGSATFGVIETDNDVQVVQAGYTVGGSSDQRIQAIDNPDGSLGTLILRPSYMGINSLEFVTSANSIVQFNRSDSELRYGDNAGISGAGSFWRDLAGTMIVQREMTYTGRTMLENGTVQLSSTNVNEVFYRGALPIGTVVEIASGATLDLNGLDQQVGGLTDWRGRFGDQAASSGQVLLNGATLTIHSVTNTSFGGRVEGAGTLVKSGPQSFTLSAGYTNAAGRTLRVEEGLLEVSGALSVEAGAFELAGGTISAGSLAAQDVTWEVTLTAANEGQTLVTVTDADITGGQLNLSLATGYTPGLGETFLLLSAADTIAGASTAGMFQYQDGEEFTLGDGTEVRIDFDTGSEHVQLTVIPEPGSLLLMVVALAGLVHLRRGKRS